MKKLTTKALNKIVLRSINISAPGDPLRESFQSKEFEKTPWGVEGGTPLLKHVGDQYCHTLYLMKSILWLIYCKLL